MRVPAGSYLCTGAYGVRHEVFVREQHVPETLERDDDDATATHFVAIAAGEVVGTLRILFKPEHAKIGRVAVLRPWRGQGIAKKLMLAAMDFCRAQGQDRLYLTSQTDKVGLYQKLGFVAFGDEFEDGGMPHFAMRTYAPD